MTPGANHHNLDRRYSPRNLLIGFNSIRGRYVYAALVFVLYVVLTAWFSEITVTQSIQSSEEHLSEYETVRDLLQDVNDEIWTVEHSLQGYLLTPSKSQKQEIQKVMADLRGDILSMPHVNWISKDQQTSAVVSSLVKDTEQLGKDINRLMDMRVSVEQLFPSNSILRQTMHPANAGFYNAATLAMQEARGIKEQAPLQNVYLRFSEIRHVWIRLVAAFRVYSSNRYGVLADDPGDNMADYQKNIGMYYDQVVSMLDELDQMSRKDLLELEQMDLLEEMKQHSAQWWKGYTQVREIYNSGEEWRNDIPLLKKVIQPAFVNVWRNLHNIQKNMDASADSDMHGLLTTADRVSQSNWTIALTGIILTVIGFLFFEFLIRRPIVNIADALKAEARGTSRPLMLKVNTVETSNLIEAFDYMREQVHIRQERLQAILDNAAEGVITMDTNGVIESVNKAAVRLFGFHPSQLIGNKISMLLQNTNINDLLSNTREEEYELLGRNKDAKVFPLALKLSTFTLKDRMLYIGLFADISERKKIISDLKYVAEHDVITGVYNRNYFERTLKKQLKQFGKGKIPQFCVLYVDVDNFKYINDTLGHAAGDRLLVETAHILYKGAGTERILARFGGDEFTILINDTSPNVAISVAESYRKEIEDHVFIYAGGQYRISCSIGVAAAEADQTSADDLLAQADFANYIAKRSGRNRVHLFVPANEDERTEMSYDIGWSHRINSAVEEEQFKLAFQPIVNTSTARIESYEILIRMIDQSGELILPGGFLPTAERFGLAIKIDTWVIKSAIRILLDQHKTKPGLRFSINLGGQILSDPRLCGVINEEIKNAGISPAALTFEVTETVAISDMLAAEKILREIKNMGCSTALDDFGAGMSSFGYLKDLPVDIVKIDGKFVKNMANSKVDQAMVKAMTDVAHVLNKKVVAEFVENQETLKLLTQLGVDYVQGFYIGKPVLDLPVNNISTSAAQTLEV